MVISPYLLLSFLHFFFAISLFTKNIVERLYSLTNNLFSFLFPSLILLKNKTKHKKNKCKKTKVCKSYLLIIKKIMKKEKIASMQKKNKRTFMQLSFISAKKKKNSGKGNLTTFITDRTTEEKKMRSKGKERRKGKDGKTMTVLKEKALEINSTVSVFMQHLDPLTQSLSQSVSH